MATVERREKSRLEYAKNADSPTKSPALFSVTMRSPMGQNIAERSKAFSGSSPLAASSSKRPITKQSNSAGVGRVDYNRLSAAMNSPPVQDTALCPANIVATRRRLFTPGSTKKDTVHNKADTGALRDQIRASSPSSDKENSAKCDVSNRTKSSETTPLSSIAKILSFDDLRMDHQKKVVKEKALDNDDFPIDSTKIRDHEKAMNPRSLFEERKQWLQGRVTSANSFTEIDQPKTNSKNVTTARTMLLQKQASTNTIAFAGRVERVERAVSARRLRISDPLPPAQVNSVSVQEEVNSVSVQEEGGSGALRDQIRASSFSSDKENPAKSDLSNRIKTSQTTRLTSIAKSIPFDDPPTDTRKEVSKENSLSRENALQAPCEIRDHEQPMNPRSLFEERKRWLQGRVMSANSFTESEGERKGELKDELRKNPINIVATRTMLLQKQASTNTIVFTGRVERAASAPRLRMSDPLPPAQLNSIFRPQGRLPPTQTNGLEPKISSSHSFHQESRPIPRRKKTKSAKATTLVASRAHWLQNQVRKNQFFEDVPTSSDDEDEEMEKPKTDIQLRLEALQKEMTVEKPMATLGVPPKRNWADLP